MYWRIVVANRLLRNIAVSIGAGLAAGIARRMPSRPVTRTAPDFYPLLDRIEDIESRVTRVELAPSPIATPAPEEIEAIGTLVSSQAEDIAALRHDLLTIERRNAEQVEAFGQKIALLEHQLPVNVEAAISQRMTELEQRLRGEFQEIHYRTVDMFAETIEKRVVNRINTLENSLIEQSHSISSLREKSQTTDHNLHRLLEAVERLCDRAETKSQTSLLKSDLPVPAPPAPETPKPAPVPVPEPAVAPVARTEDRRENEWHPEPDIAGTAVPLNGSSASPSRVGLKPVGMAILGLAILGLRLFK